MRSNLAAALVALSLSLPAAASEPADTLPLRRIHPIGEVVVTGTRNRTDIRHLPMTVSVVGRETIERTMQPSLLPVLTEQVPGLFTTARGVMGYGVSGGAAGGISLRGLSGGSARMMVLYRRSSAIFGYLRPPDSRRLPDDAGRSGRGAAGPRLGALRLQRHGRRGKYRHAQDARRRRAHRSACRLRLLQHARNRAHESRACRAIHVGGQRFVQPHGRSSRRHELRAVRRLCKAGLRDRPALDCERRCQRNALQRLLPGPRVGAARRRRPTHYARRGVAGLRERVRTHLGRAESVLQLGQTPDQRRLYAEHGRVAATGALQLARRYDGRVGIPEHASVRGRPPYAGLRLVPLRRQGVDGVCRGRAGRHEPRYSRQTRGRAGRIYRPAPACDALAYDRCGHPSGQPLARG